MWYSSELRLIFMIVSNHGWDNDCSRAENNKGWYRISSPVDRSQSMLESLPAYPRAMPSVELARRLGENMKYLIFDRKHNPLIYILFGSAAWKCAPGMTLSAGMRLQGKQISNSWPVTCGFWYGVFNDTFLSYFHQTFSTSRLPHFEFVRKSLVVQNISWYEVKPM